MPKGGGKGSTITKGGSKVEIWDFTHDKQSILMIENKKPEVKILGDYCLKKMQYFPP